MSGAAPVIQKPFRRDQIRPAKTFGEAIGIGRGQSVAPAGRP
jgi:hypothetical protein